MTQSPSQLRRLRRRQPIAAVAAAVCLAAAAQPLYAQNAANLSPNRTVVTVRNPGNASGRDNQAPSAPTDLAATNVSYLRVELSWSAAADNLGVTGYRVYRNGVLLGTTAALTYADTEMSSSSAYDYRVVAIDAAGNASTPSQIVHVVTPPNPALATTGEQPVFAETALRISDSIYSGSTWEFLLGGLIKAPWKNLGGDWVDRDGVLQGKQPWATAGIVARNAEQVLNFDVKALILRHLADGPDRIPNRGWIIKQEPGTTIGSYYSREHANAAKRPLLTVTTTTGVFTLSPGADAHLAASAKLPTLNSKTSMSVEGSQRIALWFDLSKLTGTVLNATLRLTSTNVQYSGGVGKLGLYPVDTTAIFAPIPVRQGIAAEYPADVGIETHPDVVFVERFPDLDMHRRGWWWDADNGFIRYYRSLVGDSDQRDPNYKPLSPGVNAYRMEIPTGGVGGDFGIWHFWSNLGEEPEEIYMRAYARIGTNFDSSVGKFPFGFDGTYSPHRYLVLPGTGLTQYLEFNPVTGRPWLRPDKPASAASGGARSTGRNGWSARGDFVTSDCNDSTCLSPASNPLTAAGYRSLGYYTYWADQPQETGTGFAWRNGLLGLVPKNTWFAIDEYVKLNSVNPDGSGNKDGILRAWINGRLAYEKTDFRVRHWPGNPAGARNIKLNGAWLNFYHGGLDKARSPMVFYLADVVIAKSFIGPTEFPPPIPAPNN